jgi:hypothetical protein
MTERLLGEEFARIGVRHWTSTSSYSDWFTNQRLGPLGPVTLRAR